MKTDYEATSTIDIPGPTLKAITQAFFQLQAMILADFFAHVVGLFAEHYMRLKRKPFCCPKCGNSHKFIWKSRRGKKTTVLSLFGLVKLPQLQVQCVECGRKMYITRKLLGVEARTKIPRETVRKLDCRQR